MPGSKCFRLLTAVVVLSGLSLASLVLLAGCKGNQPPYQVGKPSGPQSVPRGRFAAFTITATDPDGDSVAMRFDWGDGDTSAWSALVASGASVTDSHAWAATDTYLVRAQAKDQAGLESDWSEPLNVSVAEPPDRPIVSAEATDIGASLLLHWAAVANADCYDITTDDSIYTTTDTSFDVSVPTTSVSVKSVSGTIRSDPATIDCRVVESTVAFYGDLDPTHSNGFGFSASGSADTYSLSYPSFFSMDFYANGGSFGEMRLASARELNNNKLGNGVNAASVSYDDVAIADPVGVYCDSSLVITAGSTYYLRMSADSIRIWSTGDNFAKAKVVSIDGYKVTLELGYQKIGGLRWLRSQ